MVVLSLHLWHMKVRVSESADTLAELLVADWRVKRMRVPPLAPCIVGGLLREAPFQSPRGRGGPVPFRTPFAMRSVTPSCWWQSARIRRRRGGGCVLHEHGLPVPLQFVHCGLGLSPTAGDRAGGRTPIRRRLDGVERLQHPSSASAGRMRVGLGARPECPDGPVDEPSILMRYNHATSDHRKAIPCPLFLKITSMQGGGAIHVVSWRCQVGAVPVNRGGEHEKRSCGESSRLHWGRACR